MSTSGPAQKRENPTGRSAAERQAAVRTGKSIEQQGGPPTRRAAGQRRTTPKRTDARQVADEPDAEEALSALQEILFGTDRDRIQVLSADVEQLRHQIGDRAALAAAVAPILGSAIRRQIQESRDEMIDALYPIIGQLVVRAVTEAMRDLARSIDARLQAATDFQRIRRRVRSLVTGVPVGELALRDGFPFAVQEVYLIHRESGLLLWHATRAPEPSTDSDLVGSMLTAIREFAEQVLGGKDNLQQLRFGNRELVLEFGRYAYVGALIAGVTPSDFRWKLHRRVYAFEKKVYERLRRYDGDASTLSDAARREFEPFLVADPALSGNQTGQGNGL